MRNTDSHSDELHTSHYTNIPLTLLPLQLPRYKSLKTQLVKVIEHLVMSTVPEGVASEKGKSLNYFKYRT